MSHLLYSVFTVNRNLTLFLVSKLKFMTSGFGIQFSWCVDSNTGRRSCEKNILGSRLYGLYTSPAQGEGVGVGGGGDMREQEERNLGDWGLCVCVCLCVSVGGRGVGLGWVGSLVILHVTGAKRGSGNRTIEAAQRF